MAAPQTFQHWFRLVHKPAAGTRASVVLWDDCHLSFHQPQLGQAAERVLEAMGFGAICLQDRRCCGRPMISKGLLKEAAANARHNVDRLIGFARQGLPIIGVEPSCVACFRDEYPDLLSGDDARQVAQQSFFFEEFVTQADRRPLLQAVLTSMRPSQKILVHTHCYQKAMGTAEHVLDMLRLLPGTEVAEIACGCCGMAGPFGFEKEHCDLSMAIGEQALFPAIRAVTSQTLVAAAGTSCRQQIKDGSQRRPAIP